MQRDGVLIAPGGECLHASERKRWESQATYRAQWRQVANDDPKRVSGAQLVIAVGGDDQSVRMRDAPAKKAQEVERCLICPMDILEYRNGRWWIVIQFCQKRAEKPMARRSLAGKPLQCATHLRGNVKNWPQGSGRGKWIARANHDPRMEVGTHTLAEARDQSALTYSSFAAKKVQATLSGRGLARRLSQLVQVGRAFQERHGGQRTRFATQNSSHVSSCYHSAAAPRRSRPGAGVIMWAWMLTAFYLGPIAAIFSILPG